MKFHKRLAALPLTAFVSFAHARQAPTPANTAAAARASAEQNQQGQEQRGAQYSSRKEVDHTYDEQALGTTFTAGGDATLGALSTDTSKGNVTLTGSSLTADMTNGVDNGTGALAVATIGLAGKNAYDAVMSDPTAVGGVGINVSLGTSHSNSNSVASSSTAVGRPQKGYVVVNDRTGEVLQD
jgi:hypothetical protein